MPNKRFEFTWQNAVSWLKGVGLASVGAVLAVVTDAVTETDFGAWSAVVGAAWAAIANAVRLWLRKHE